MRRPKRVLRPRRTARYTRAPARQATAVSPRRFVASAGGPTFDAALPEGSRCSAHDAADVAGASAAQRAAATATARRARTHVTTLLARVRCARAGAYAT